MIKTAEAQIPARLSLPLFEERQVELTDASSSPASRAKRVLAIDKKTAFRPLAAAEELPPAPRTVKITSHIAVRMPTTTSSMSSRTIMPAEPSMVRVKDLQIDEYASEPSAEVQPVEKRQLKPILRFS